MLQTETIKNVVQVGIMAVKEIISAAFQIITLPFRLIWENCKDTVLSIWEGIKSAISGALDAIKSAISEKLEAAKNVVSTVTEGIKTVASNAWNAISSTASSVWETVKGAISDKINAAQQVVSSVTGTIQSVASSAWNTVSSTASSLWESTKSTISSKLTAAQQTVSSVTSTIKSVASSAWSSVSSTASSLWGTVQSTIGSKINAAWTTVTSAVNGIKSSVSGALNGALSTVRSIFGSIHSGISEKINAAKNVVSNAINAIKGFFNFSWSLPKLKLPHISISGSFSLTPPSVPHFGIEWYAEGGILTQPTIFGASGNNLLAGGEAGAEAVVPLATLWEKLDAMIRSVFNSASTTGGSPDAGLTAKAGELLAMDDFSLGTLAGNGGTVIYYDFSGFTWSPQIQGGGNGDEDDLMARLRAHEAEFFDWLEEFIQMREVAQYA